MAVINERIHDLDRRLREICTRAAEVARKQIPSADMRDLLMDPAVAALNAERDVIACSSLRHLGSIGYAARMFLENTRLDMTGDVVVAFNDPFSGSTRLNDFFAVRRLKSNQGYVVATGSASDIGGEYFGNYHPAATEVWAEGNRITPTILYKNGAIVRDAMTCVALNSRTPRLLGSLLQGLIDATLEAERALEEQQDIGDEVKVLLDVTEAAARDRLARIAISPEPSGAAISVGEQEGACVRLRPAVDSDRLVLDFRESDRQMVGYYNATRGATLSVVVTQLFAAAPELPFNDGVLRPLEVRTSSGTVVDAAYPVATAGGYFGAGNAVARALSAALDPVADWHHPGIDLVREDGRLSATLSAALQDDERQLAPFPLPSAEI